MFLKGLQARKMERTIYIHPSKIGFSSGTVPIQWSNKDWYYLNLRLTWQGDNLFVEIALMDLTVFGLQNY